MECKSHPDKDLYNHLKSVKNIGLKKFNKNKNIKFDISNEEIEKTLEIVLFYHDIGKATKYFQEYLKAKINKEEYKDDEKLTYHSLISASIASYKVYNLLENSDNRELLSLFSFIAIRKHHGNFENIEEMLTISKNNLEIMNKQMNNIICKNLEKYIEDIKFEKLEKFIKELLFFEFEEKMENYYLLNYIYSILTYSDKTEVAIGFTEDIKFPENIGNIVDKYKAEKFKNLEKIEINKLRENIYNESIKTLNKVYKTEKIFSLNVPTGGGKTLSVLNLAFKLMGKDKNVRRIIYALPYTSIIDQTEKILKDIFKTYGLNSKNYLLTHHHMAETKIKYGENDFEGNKAQLLIENWDKPFILTTFWQLFNSLITNKNSQLRKFHNIANSIIILDEIQTIPYEYWELINKLFIKLTEIFDCRIIFLTATMPLIFREDKKEIYPLIDKNKRNEYFSKFNRYKINILKNKKSDEIQSYNINELFEEAVEDIERNKNKNFLFVFNTIKSSKNFFELLKEKNFSNRELIYLSTNILPIERKKRIERIKKSSQRKIVVSTQLIEAGVDIDLDIVYRDFTIFDSLIQTAGRCNRNNRKDYVGNIKVFKLKNDNDRYDYNYIYKKLQIIITNEILSNNNNFFEKDLLVIIDKYFSVINQKKSNNESTNLLNSIKSLNYEKIEKDFELIEEIPSSLIFVERNKKASQLLKNLKEIINIENKFERKSEFLKIKNEFFQYTLSVRKNLKSLQVLSSFPNIGNLKVIEKDFVEQYYKSDTGLNLDIDNFF
ncbi:MAG: hypothetical protein B6I28_05170 [Fusobacteriia bacterium 4572_132]|nr:MAG: hypothetical protein B6I28_05170 [Fusobacteriia bacterium 4572_132]